MSDGTLNLDGRCLNLDGSFYVSWVGGRMSESPVALMQQLHDEHAAALWGFCMRLTGQDRARAEDVVQETWLRAWRNSKVLDQSQGSAS